MKKATKNKFLVFLALAVLVYGAFYVFDPRPFKVERYYRYHGVAEGPKRAEAFLYSLHPIGSDLGDVKKTLEASGLETRGGGRTPREAGITRPAEGTCCVLKYWDEFRIASSLFLWPASGEVYVEYDTGLKITGIRVLYRGFEWL